MTPDETAISQQICPSCPLESCNDRSPECPLRAFMSESWLKLNPVNKGPREAKPRNRKGQKNYRTTEQAREYFKSYYEKNRAKKLEASKARYRKVKRYSPDQRREFFKQQIEERHHESDQQI
jgi:hypothetical protein